MRPPSFISKKPYQFRRRPMTYAIGASCKDGVVLAADRRLFDGKSFSGGNKIFSCKNILVAAAGLTGIMDKLFDELDKQIDETSHFTEKINTIEDIVRRLNAHYIPRLRRKFTLEEIETGNLCLIELLVAIKDNVGKIRLYHVGSDGYSELVKEGNYRAIGSGEPYGAVFLKKNWDYWRDELNYNTTATRKGLIREKIPFDMINTAPLLIFSIMMVALLEVDAHVGEGYNICVFKDGKEPKELTSEEYDFVLGEAYDMTEFCDLGQYRKEREEEEEKFWKDKNSKKPK